jgi:hypothetical protein
LPIIWRKTTAKARDLEHTSKDLQERACSRLPFKIWRAGQHGVSVQRVLSVTGTKVATSQGTKLVQSGLTAIEHDGSGASSDSMSILVDGRASQLHRSALAVEAKENVFCAFSRILVGRTLTSTPDAGGIMCWWDRQCVTRTSQEFDDAPRPKLKSAPKNLCSVIGQRRIVTRANDHCGATFDSMSILVDGRASQLHRSARHWRKRKKMFFAHFRVFGRADSNKRAGRGRNCVLVGSAVCRAHSSRV